jgi:predicted Zn-dependent peptidase
VDKLTNLENNMTKSIYVPSNIGLSLLAIVYPLGSDYESEGHRGTHHLMEHLMCKSFDHLLPKLKRLGINYNASTDTNRIVFFFDGLDESIALVAQELYDCITSGTYTWSENDFNNEKKTVLQEYEDVFNGQVGGTLANIFRKYYNYYDPIGFRADVELFSYSDSLEFRKRFKYPNLLCQVGGQNITVSEDTWVQFGLQRPVFGPYTVPLENIPKKKKFLGLFGEGGKTVVGLVSKSVVPKCYINKIGLVVSCLNDGLESPLLQEIRDKNGLSYFSIGMLFPMFNFGAVTFLSCTSDRNTNQLQSVYRKFLSGDLSRHISKDRFEDCYQGLMIEKKIGERLPHKGAMNTIVQDSPYEGLDGFTYQDALELLDRYFKIDMFEEIVY